MKLIAWFAALLIIVVAAHASAGERPTAEELLAAHEKSVEKLARVQIEWTHPADKTPDEKPAGGGDQHTVYRDGARWKVDRFIWSPGRGGIPDMNIREQTLIGDEVVFVSQTYRAPDFQPGRANVAARRGERAAEETLPERIGQCRVVFGRMFGDAGYPLWTIMREAVSLELLPQTESVDGAETYVLKSQGKYGEHQVWLDPASGGLPRRIEVHKYPGHLLNGEQLGASPAPETIRSSLRGIYREYLMRIDKIQIENRDGAFVMTGWESGENSTLTNGKPRVEKIEQRFRVLNVNPKEFPENAFKFDIEIPNGTLASVREANQERYSSNFHWEDGKILPGMGK